MDYSVVIKGNICQTINPQQLNLAERMERAVYLGLDEKNITAKFVAGEKIFV